MEMATPPSPLRTACGGRTSERPTTWIPRALKKQQILDRSDLAFMQDDRYAQRCALSYFRENQRRLWVFAVAVGVGLAVLSLIWTGLTFMQQSASGLDLSRARQHLARIIIGVVVLACAAIVWEGLNEVLFSGVDFWTFDRSVFYGDLRR